jgi:hypothetical protein
VNARPFETGATDADRISHRLTAREYEIESSLGCRNHNRARCIIEVEAHEFTRDRPLLNGSRL